MLSGIPGLSSSPCPESSHPSSPLPKSFAPLPTPLPPPPNGCRVLHKGSGQDTTNPFKAVDIQKSRSRTKTLTKKSRPPCCPYYCGRYTHPDRKKTSLGREEGGKKTQTVEAAGSKFNSLIQHASGTWKH